MDLTKEIMEKVVHAKPPRVRNTSISRAKIVAARKRQKLARKKARKCA